MRVPVVTYVLIAINVFIYILTALDPAILYYGELNPAAVAHGAYWQLFTAMFLHYSVPHIGLNMVSLYCIGRFTELIYGSLPYLLLYLISGFLGNIASLVFLPYAQAAGASSAIFGVFGALGIFLLKQSGNLGSAGRSMLNQWIFWLALNLYFGFSASGIDMAGHLGGLFTGFVLGTLLLMRRAGN